MSISKDIENKINIVELVSKYVPLKKAGTNFKACCPFHNEKTPSFIVSPAKNIAYCFSCHKGGGPINFLMEIEKIEFREALQALAKEAGVELRSDFSKDSERRSDVYEIYKIAAENYHTELFLPENREKLEYVRSRGLTDETVAKFKIGYSGNPRELFAKLKSRGIPEQDILDSGIFVGPGRDKFYGRIIFPIANYSGNVVAFTGRIVGQGEPKYLNSPASKIFDKSSILYGLHLAKSEIGKRGSAIVVEGQMDTVSLHQAGILNAVGISGTALTKEHATYLKRLTSKIFLCLDSDDAGTKATFASIEALANEEFEVRIIRIPNGKDPDEYVKNGGDFNELQKHSLSVVEFFIKEGGRRYDLTGAPGKTAMIRDLLRFVRGLTDRIEADMRLREISRAMDVSLDTLYAELRGIREKRPEERKIEKSDGFEIGEILAGYCTLYDFYDLYSENFPYTSPHCRDIPSFSVLERVVKSRNSEDAGIDQNRHKAVEVSIEAENSELTPEAVRLKFLENVREIKRRAYSTEYYDTMDSIEPGDDIAASSAMIRLQSKARQLGIPHQPIPRNLLKTN